MGSFREYGGNLLRGLVFPGKRRLCESLFPHQGLRRARIFGCEFDLDLAEFIQRNIYYGTLEPRDARVVSRYLRPGMTVVDAGANAGFYTALAAHAVGPQGRVVAYEPSRDAAHRLRQLVARNHVAQVELVEAALGEEAGSGSLYFGLGGVNHTPTLLPHPGAAATSVEVRRLDEEADRLGLRQIDLLKIDVQGYETRLLRGARELLRRRRIAAVLCEFDDFWLAEAGSSARELEATLGAGGLTEVKLPRGCENRLFTRGTKIRMPAQAADSIRRAPSAIIAHDC